MYIGKLSNFQNWTNMAVIAKWSKQDSLELLSLITRVLWPFLENFQLVPFYCLGWNVIATVLPLYYSVFTSLLRAWPMMFPATLRSTNTIECDIIYTILKLIKFPTTFIWTFSPYFASVDIYYIRKEIPSLAKSIIFNFILKLCKTGYS